MSDALSFQVRIGIPGSLTIEIDSIQRLVEQTPQTLIPPVRQDLVTVPNVPSGKLIPSRGWGSGFFVPIAQRLNALGGSTILQLLQFECPSIDVTDMGWGATLTVDATSDPVTISGPLFGASVYGRVPEVGDYVLWNDSTVVANKYAYEISRILRISINGTNVSLQLQRRPRTAPAGSAYFGSIMTAHMACPVLLLLNPTFNVLWDGSHQVFKFLWDQMIVSAVQATTLGIPNPGTLPLFPIPPAGAAPGLAT